ALWTAVRTFKEKAVLARQLAARERHRGNLHVAQRFEEDAKVAQDYGDLIQVHVLKSTPTPPTGDPGAQPWPGPSPTGGGAAGGPGRGAEPRGGNRSGRFGPRGGLAVVRRPARPCGTRAVATQTPPRPEDALRRLRQLTLDRNGDADRPDGLEAALAELDAA